MWPLPGLVLLEWAVLGVVGFLATASATRPDLSHWFAGLWFVAGALLPLMVLGAFSIGPLVFVSLIAFLGAAIAATARRKSRFLPHLGLLAAGVIVNLILLFLAVILGRPRF